MTLFAIRPRLVGLFADIAPHEGRAVALAFACNFVLLASYYILRPLRDTMATVFGVEELQNLFTGTFVLTFLCAPLYSALAARLSLTRFLPGLFWFWLGNILVFYFLFRLAPHDRWIAAAYFWWFSTVNLFLISVFWTLMADIFSPRQATRLFALIAAGGSTGAIAGPAITTLFVHSIGVGGLLLVAAAGFLLVIVLIHLLMREKTRLRALAQDSQPTRLDHALPGKPFDGFTLLLRSPMMLGQALFMLLMTWIATILYFMQTDLISQAYSALESRTVAFADLDLVVNVCSALILIFGMGRVVSRFGVTLGLILSPLVMLLACLGIGASPTLMMVQTARGLQRITQYAVARPSREILFTVADQDSKYKAKNVIDTVVYRFGDVSSAWMQAGLKVAGFGLAGVVGLGVAVSAAWAATGLLLGRHYEMVRRRNVVTG
jgi:AAA family ATP:ADP antiporter